MGISYGQSMEINPTASDFSPDIMWITNLIATLPKTNSSPLKHGGWKMVCSFCDCLFSRGELLVSGNVDITRYTSPAGAYRDAQRIAEDGHVPNPKS